MHPDAVTTEVAYLLYLCHLLSTWNARMYEFAAVVFTAAAFPKDLLASSVFGIILSLCVLIFASLLGTWVDRASSRLATLISTISANRISVVGACVCWFFIVTLQKTQSPSDSIEVLMTRKDAEIQPHSVVRGLKISLFAIAIFLSIVERLSRTANLLSIERDWIPAMAAPITGIKGGETSKHGLTQMNAVMSRIDLICKLLSPIALSAFTSAIGSVRVIIAALLILNVITWPVEIWSATRVWKLNRRLRESKVADVDVTDARNLNAAVQSRDERGCNLLKNKGNGWQQSRQWVYQAIVTTYKGVAIWLLDYQSNIKIYFAYSVWLPSIALSTLHFSVLNYSPTLTIYLLNSGFALNFITVAKALSAIAELASTFFTPWEVRMAGKIWERGNSIDKQRVDVLSHGAEENEELLQQHDEDQEDRQREADHFAPQTDMGVALLGFWSLIQMFLSLIPACIALWAISFSSNASENPLPPSIFISVILLITIPLSRFGRWTNHLTTQQLTQTMVHPSHRSGFGGAEMCFVSLFGLSHWVVTAIWSKHAQFRWLALASVAAVGLSSIIYFGWLTRQNSWKKRISDDQNPGID